MFEAGVEERVMVAKPLRTVVEEDENEDENEDEDEEDVPPLKRHQKTDIRINLVLVVHYRSIWVQVLLIR